MNAVSHPQSPSPVHVALVAPGLWRRMACWLYEGMLLFAVVFIAGWLFSTLTQMRNAVDGSRHPMLQGFLFVVLGVYFTWFWSKGQTLAMKTWGIRVVDRHGRPLSQARALLRYLLGWLWILPPLWKPDSGLMQIIKDNSAPCKVLDTTVLVKDLPRGPDKIHPNAEGREAWAEAVFQWLKKSRAPAGPKPWSLLDQPP